MNYSISFSLNQFQFSNNVYTSKESSFQEGPFSAPDTTTIALIAGLGAAGCLALLLIAAILFFCGCKILRKNAKKNKVSTSARCPVDDEDRRNNYGYGYRVSKESVVQAFSSKSSLSKCMFSFSNGIY